MSYPRHSEDQVLAATLRKLQNKLERGEVFGMKDVKRVVLLISKIDAPECGEVLYRLYFRIKRKGANISFAESQIMDAIYPVKKSIGVDEAERMIFLSRVPLPT